MTILFLFLLVVIALVGICVLLMVLGVTLRGYYESAKSSARKKIYNIKERKRIQNERIRIAKQYGELQ